MLTHYRIQIKTDVWWTEIKCLEKINHNWEVIEILDLQDLANNDQLLEKLSSQLYPCDADFFVMPRRDLEPKTEDDKIIWCEINSLELTINQDLSFIYNTYVEDKHFSIGHFIFLIKSFLKHNLEFSSKLYKANFWTNWKSEVAQYKKRDVMDLYDYLSDHQKWLLNNHYKKWK